MNGWIKYFADGTKEIGTDYDTRMKKASWSRGRLSDMVGVEVIHNNKRLAIFAPGEYWQSDDYDCNIFEPTPSLVVRRLQKKIEISDGLQLSRTNNCITVKNVGYGFPNYSAGQWLTLEYDIKNNKFACNIQEHKI